MAMGRRFLVCQYDTLHDDAHGAFMTLPAYTRMREGKVRQLGLCVRKCSPEEIYTGV